jgi:hypothetical protein
MDQVQGCGAGAFSTSVVDEGSCLRGCSVEVAEELKGHGEVEIVIQAAVRDSV